MKNMTQAFEANNFEPRSHNLWRGEITLDAINDLDSNFNPGVPGCGIICSNLSDESILACERLGRGLEDISEMSLNQKRKI